MRPENLLGLAQSPYLRQHAANPVHWRTWGEAALEEAKARDCPILLSIGYAACHWCHVMAHESFEDEQTATVMNQHFVSIKVDREERPDVDYIYMSALQAFGEQGGWPLTMFLTPTGAPFWGGTYFPPTPRWGRPSFRQVLEGVAAAYRSRDQTLRVNEVGVADAMTRMFARHPGRFSNDLSAMAAQELLESVDTRAGGFKGAPKFPNAPAFRFLWHHGFALNDDRAIDAVHGLLRAMSAGGIYDHLGGGYARYSTDAEWLVPHFEKMLYDNAQIVELLALAHGAANDDVYAERAEQTVAWLDRELLVEDAYAASLDADSEGEEGRFYVWTAAEIEQALGPQSDFSRAYDVTSGGNWEGRTILRRITARGSLAAERHLGEQRQTLLACRENRTRPERDTKVLADWNGLAIVGLARASLAFSKPAWLTRAVAVFDRLQALLGRDDGRVEHAWCNGQVTATGLLDDQASVGRAALALFEATGENRFLVRAVELAQVAQALFGDTEGGFFMTAADAPCLAGQRPRQAMDGPSPSGVGLMAELLARLYHMTGEPTWLDLARSSIEAWSGAGRSLRAMPSLLIAADLLENGLTVSFSGASLVDPLVSAARAHPNPRVMVIPPGHSLAIGHPAQPVMKGHARQEPLAYVCGRGVCSPPVGDRDELVRLLTRRAGDA